MIDLPQAFFVTGTDTEIGKTYVSLKLIGELRAQGKKVGVMKPVSAGCDYIEGLWRNDDAMALMAASNRVQTYTEVNPFAYKEPVSPHIAAKHSGRPIDLDRVKELFDYIASSSDSVLVEGAGGWMTPLGEGNTMADLVKVLDIPVVLVVAIKLGCLNHALLTAEAIGSAGVELVGWVANDLEPDMPYLSENIKYLSESIESPLIAKASELP